MELFRLMWSDVLNHTSWSLIKLLFLDFHMAQTASVIRMHSLSASLPWSFSNPMADMPLISPIDMFSQFLGVDFCHIFPAPHFHGCKFILVLVQPFNAWLAEYMWPDQKFMHLVRWLYTDPRVLGKVWSFIMQWYRYFFLCFSLVCSVPLLPLLSAPPPTHDPPIFLYFIDCHCALRFLAPLCWQTWPHSIHETYPTYDAYLCSWNAFPPACIPW